MKYLNIPGLYNSNAAHWQSRWESLHPAHFSRVQQKNWVSPIKTEWVEQLHTSITELDSPVILVAHSLGCAAVAHWAFEQTSPHVVGALLVAPVNIEHATRDCFKTFSPIPTFKFPFPSIVVASTNDAYATMEYSAKLAAWWGSRFVCIGDKGHINADAGVADWPEGFELVQSITTKQSVHQPAYIN